MIESYAEEVRMTVLRVGKWSLAFADEWRPDDFYVGVPVRVGASYRSDITRSAHVDGVSEIWFRNRSREQPGKSIVFKFGLDASRT